MFNHDLGGGAQLRLLELRHAPEFLAFIESNRAHLAPFLQWADTTRTVQDAEDFIRRGLDSLAKDGLPWVGVWQDDALAGGLLLFPLQHNIRATEVGYWIGAGFEGRGLMRRALMAMLRYLFEDLGVNRVGLQADTENVRSQALAERLGFVQEGVKRQSWLLYGELRDNIQYSLLAAEWRTRLDRPQSEPL
ncbi:GNAT family N-acetyltransferase [Deinococcus sp.]|uniref:GNAT family N-acetyltransferase n=1 Tax=Deinococcus sp. TaxID=47478 RepID=UPI003C7B01C4